MYWFLSVSSCTNSLKDFVHLDTEVEPVIVAVEGSSLNCNYHSFDYAMQVSITGKVFLYDKTLDIATLSQPTYLSLLFNVFLFVSVLFSSPSDWFPTLSIALFLQALQSNLYPHANLHLARTIRFCVLLNPRENSGTWMVQTLYGIRKFTE